MFSPIEKFLSSLHRSAEERKVVQIKADAVAAVYVLEQETYKRAYAAQQWRESHSYMATNWLNQMPTDPVERFYKCADLVLGVYAAYAGACKTHDWSYYRVGIRSFENFHSGRFDSKFKYPASALSHSSFFESVKKELYDPQTLQAAMASDPDKALTVLTEIVRNTVGWGDGRRPQKAIFDYAEDAENASLALEKYVLPALNSFGNKVSFKITSLEGLQPIRHAVYQQGLDVMQVLNSRFLTQDRPGSTKNVFLLQPPT